MEDYDTMVEMDVNDDDDFYPSQFRTPFERLTEEEYVIMLLALKEAEDLSTANFQEIMDLYDRVHQLEATLKAHGIEIPPEED